ncbi:histamine H3 receptor-like [Saccostrea echinata]|uniref:histamine H3 receptor-like n=1 Tax=Saccostrea echinata TaxID=191078 RepID=UPI002A7F6A64|nr:histamine H3 receptor-like [Saccostrea echinata]
MNNSIEGAADGMELFPLYVTVPLGIFLAFLIIIAMLGNALTIIAFVRDKKLQTVYNMYLVNLAVTDFSLSVFSMTVYSVYTITSFAWPFGYHFCKVFLVVDFTLCLESVISIVVISLDRLLLLKHGPHYVLKESTKVATTKIAISWVLAFSLYSPAIIGWDLWTGEDVNDPEDCDVQFVYHFIFTTTTAIIEFAIPFIAISILNFLIYLEIRKRTVVFPTTITGNPPSEPNTDYVCAAAKETTRKDIKAARFLAMLVLVFVLTWAPYTITTIIISFCEECVNEYVYEFLVWLLWSKSAINPLLYAYNSAMFYKNFKEILRCKRSAANTQNSTVMSHVTY